MKKIMMALVASTMLAGFSAPTFAAFNPANIDESSHSANIYKVIDKKIAKGKTSGVHGMFAWAEVEGEVYSVALSELRKYANPGKRFSEIVGEQVMLANIEKAEESVATMKKAIVKAVFSGADVAELEAANAMVELLTARIEMVRAANSDNLDVTDGLQSDIDAAEARLAAATVELNARNDALGRIEAARTEYNNAVTDLAAARGDRDAAETRRDNALTALATAQDAIGEIIGDTSFENIVARITTGDYLVDAEVVNDTATPDVGTVSGVELAHTFVQTPDGLYYEAYVVNGVVRVGAERLAVQAEHALGMGEVENPFTADPEDRVSTQLITLGTNGIPTAAQIEVAFAGHLTSGGTVTVDGVTFTAGDPGTDVLSLSFNGNVPAEFTGNANAARDNLATPLDVALPMTVTVTAQSADFREAGPLQAGDYISIPGPLTNSARTISYAYFNGSGWNVVYDVNELPAERTLVRALTTSEVTDTRPTAGRLQNQHIGETVRAQVIGDLNTNGVPQLGTAAVTGTSFSIGDYTSTTVLSTLDRSVINRAITEAFEDGYGDGYEDGFKDGYVDGFGDGVASVTQ